MQADEDITFEDDLTEEQRRWRMILGERAEQLSDDAPCGGGTSWLSGQDLMMDRVLAMVYGGTVPCWWGTGGRRAQAGPAVPSSGIGESDLSIPDWLTELRRSFPKQSAEVVTADAMRRDGFEQILTDPACLAKVEANVPMVARLLGLKNLVPEEAKAIARDMVRRVVEQVQAEMLEVIQRAMAGPPDPVRRVRSGPTSLLDWRRTVRANLKHFSARIGTVVPERVYYKERRSESRQDGNWEIVIAVDQSGSMGESFVYSCVTASVLASLRALSTKLFLFDTRVTDMSAHLKDPVDILFGATLGGGTCIADAVMHVAGHITNPKRTLFALITDLEEYGNSEPMFQALGDLKAKGVTVVSLLGMTNQSVPHYAKDNAERLVSMGIPAFCATPARFGELIGRCLRNEDLSYLNDGGLV